MFPLALTYKINFPFRIVKLIRNILHPKYFLNSRNSLNGDIIYERCNSFKVGINQTFSQFLFDKNFHTFLVFRADVGNPLHLNQFGSLARNFISYFVGYGRNSYELREIHFGGSF